MIEGVGRRAKQVNEISPGKGGNTVATGLNLETDCQMSYSYIWTVSLVYHICLLIADAIMKGLGRHPFHRQLGTPPDPVVVGTVYS